ncbi:MAG: polyhydroxybutyrate depolymerase [Chlamydiales bacterium]|jgi:polyhydroxybutyrate depolymerase
MLAAAALLLGQSARAGDTTVDAGRGPVSVHVPAGYSPAVPMPLVMLLHGYSADGPGQEAYMQFTPLSDERGFLYLYPNGTLDGAGNRFWNGTNACCDFAGSGIDDSGYLRDLIEAVGQALNVDERRVYLIGHSNGGFMSHRLACDHPDLITAIASLAGATWNNAAACGAASGVHVLQVHGTNDTTIFYNGGNLTGSVYPGAVATVEQWAGFAGCSLTPDNSAPPLDLDASLAGDETTVRSYPSGCSNDGSAELWTINGGGHIPALSADFSPAVVDFLFDHARAGLGASYCVAAPNSAGDGARIAGLGSDVVADGDFTLIVEGLPASVFGLFFFGPNAIQSPFGDGFRCVGGSTQRLYPLTRANDFGTAARSVNLIAAPALGSIVPGSNWNFQLWYRDGGGPGGTGFNVSDGLNVAFQ